MKITFLILLLFAALTINAQTAETLSELTPIPSNIGKFTKNVPKYKDRILGISYEIKFDVKFESVNLSDGKKAVAVMILANRAEEFVFESLDDVPTARLSVYGRITSKDKSTDGFFEEKSTLIAPLEELNNIPKTRSVISRKVFALPAGNYQIGVIVRDLITKMRGVRIVKFQIQ